MGLLSGIYDSEPIQPVARVKENLSIYTSGKYEHYIIDFQEPIPPGPASTINMVALSPGITTLAAGGTIVKIAVVALQLNSTEFLHLRWEPIDNVEGVLWEQAGQARLNSANIQSRVNRMTRSRDPYLATTTFFILGRNRDMNLEVRNPMRYATPTARFVFWGNRSILTAWDFSKNTPEDQAKLAAGDLATVKRIIGQTTWLPAEGRGA